MHEQSPPSGLRLYTQKLDDEINKFADKTIKCDLRFIIDDIVTIHGLIGELDKAYRFAVLPEDLSKQYRELKMKFNMYKDIFEGDCNCTNVRLSKHIKQNQTGDRYGTKRSSSPKI